MQRQARQTQPSTLPSPYPSPKSALTNINASSSSSILHDHSSVATIQNNNINNNTVIQTIDQIIDHHYFKSRLQQLLQTSSIGNGIGKNNRNSGVNGLLDDQYYKEQDDIVEDIAGVIHGVVQQQLRQVLTNQFINVQQQIQGIKQQMFIFMDQQSKKTQDFKKQLNKFAQQLKRRASTNQAMSSTGAVVNSTGGYTGGIRFMRSGIIQSTSSGSSTNLPNNSTSGTDNKSFHSELMTLRKQMQQLRQKAQKSQLAKIIEQQFNQFKIQTKVALQSLKQQSKKQQIQLATLSKSSSQAQTLVPALKQQIQSSVKRTITAQLKAYATYSDQILQLRQQLQKYEQKLQQQGNLHNQYLSGQLKSVWLVLNDMKRNLDQCTENLGLNSSREIL